MPTRTVRARVHGGHLEPLEALSLAEGSDVTVSIDVPNVHDRDRQARGHRTLRASSRRVLVRAL